MSISVVDLNEEAKEEQPAPAIEAEEAKEPEPITDTANEIIEEPKEEQHEVLSDQRNPVEAPTPEPKAKPKPKPKPKANDIVNCEKCHKAMTYKNLRYSHKCEDEPKPVKKQTNPKSKPKPKPKAIPQPIYEEEEEARRCPATSREAPPQAVIRQQPANPLTNLQQHYQLLQQQYIKQKQEKYNNLRQNMFASKPKKR